MRPGQPRRWGGPHRSSAARRKWTLSGSVLGAVLLVAAYFALSGKDDEHSDYNRFLPTKWTYKVSASKPWPEYPRPQMVRQQWQNLNGLWQFEGSTKTGLATPPFGRDLAEKILVPFPVQSKLSGIQRHVNYMWYRTEFTVPPAWASHRLYLHFDAIDWESTVYLNRKELGVHRGGYDKFSYDVTDVIRSSSHGIQELVVGVFDPTEHADGVPVGKQRENVPGNRSILYTPTSGIWRTVWLEPVPVQHITRVDMIPDIDKKLVSVTVQGSTDAVGLELKFQAADASGKVVAVVTGRVGRTFQVPIKEPKLWSPDTPHLYGVDVWILDARATSGIAEAAALDHVTSYTAMRKTSLGKDRSGTLRLMLNDIFVFQMGMLDQGFWPDGLYTAPTDAALAYDIEVTKQIGMNMLRKHVKVEPDRWYYHADRLGLLVWQDMPSMCGARADTWYADCWTANRTINAAAKANFERELTIMVQQHMSFPSIVMWVVFNEGWGQYETERVVSYVKRLDPSRLVNPASGWYDAPVGDVIDVHDYVEVRSPRPTWTRAAVLGEYGGLGHKIKGHLYNPVWAFAYKTYDTRPQVLAAYLELIDNITTLMKNPTTALSAAVYTELSDVENEINGVITYDRKVLRYDPAALFKAHNQMITSGTRL